MGSRPTHNTGTICIWGLPFTIHSFYFSVFLNHLRSLATSYHLKGDGRYRCISPFMSSCCCNLTWERWWEELTDNRILISTWKLMKTVFIADISIIILSFYRTLHQVLLKLSKVVLACFSKLFQITFANKFQRLLNCRVSELQQQPHFFGIDFLF